MAAAIRAYVGLGANLGRARDVVASAIDALAALPATAIVARSSYYRSAPIDATGPDFVNAVVGLDTALEAMTLLHALQAIERSHGRERPFRNAPRTLDLDLLLWGDMRRSDDELILPHPRLHRRGFVLAPLVEIAPDLEVPGLGPVAAWLERTRDQDVERLSG